MVGLLGDKAGNVAEVLAMMLLRLQWFQGLSFGHIGVCISSGVIFTVSLWQFMVGVSKQDHKAIRENAALLLASACSISSVLIESMTPLILLSEILSWIGAAFALLFAYFATLRKKKPVISRKAAATPAEPSDKIWPPPPTSHP